MAAEAPRASPRQTGVRVVKIPIADPQRRHPTVSTATCTCRTSRARAGSGRAGRPADLGIGGRLRAVESNRPERNLALPFAARGFVTNHAVTSPASVTRRHAYLDNHEARPSCSTGAHALQALVPGNWSGSGRRVGYSQGRRGRAVRAGSRARDDREGTLRGSRRSRPSGDLDAVVRYEDVLRNPDRFTASVGLAEGTVTVLRHYGFLVNRMDRRPVATRSPRASATRSSARSTRCARSRSAARSTSRSRAPRSRRRRVSPAGLACIDSTPGCSGIGAAFTSGYR